MTDFALVLLFSFVATFAIAYFIGRRDRKKYQAKPSSRGTYAQAYGRTHRTGQTYQPPQTPLVTSSDDGFLSGYLTHSLLTSDDSCSPSHDSGSSSDSCGGGESSCGGGGD